MKTLTITLAVIIQVGALMAVRAADAKKPSLDTFFEIAESASEKEFNAMSSREIERLAAILSK